MTKSTSRLTKWDETWLCESNEDKWSYVLEYIRVNWPVKVAQHIQPDWSIDKQNSVRNLFGRLLLENQLDVRGIIYPSPFKMQVLIRLKNIFTALLNLK